MLTIIAAITFAPPIVIAHRGASGERPEHTLAAYQLALEQGADFIEPDLVITKDGVLVCRHENEIGTTTDVAAKSEFAARKTKKEIDGKTFEGWFTEDFTLKELKTLRAKERLPDVRKANTAYDGQFEVPTFEEVLKLLRDWRKKSGKTVGVYPETKHSTYFGMMDLPLETPLVDLVKRYGYDKKDAPIFIQSFEQSNLKGLRRRTKARLIQLIDAVGRPFDWNLTEDKRTYTQLVSPGGLTEISMYADGVGVYKDYVIPRNAEGNLGEPSSLVRDAKQSGLLVHVWTFRNEDQFLPKNLAGEPEEEIKRFIAAGVDGLFADSPATAVKARG
ncbi:MAG: glycerophosphodiester phosphodiesterase [Chlorobia bacterium]|nr:glycerophosphodiester phosphodiesterase [Fimbriimonadaceae bacterium]